MFNVKLTASPSYAPWSNGPVERHNQTLSTMVLKVKEDVHNCSWEVAVAWSVSAKNALFNYVLHFPKPEMGCDHDPAFGKPFQECCTNFGRSQVQATIESAIRTF